MSHFSQYIQPFSHQLKRLRIEELLLENYPRQYLTQLLNYQYYLHIYAHVLDKLSLHSHVIKENMVLVDYGAGNGLLGLFAKFCGVGRVYLNDISQPFLESAKQVASQLLIEPDGFIEGDIEAVQEHTYLFGKPNVIIGTDVIEHIYNLNHFFETIKEINPSMSSVFTTASVTANRFKSRQLMKLQQNDELVGSNAEHAAPGDKYAGMAFLNIRKRIIQLYNSKLSSQAADKLATATRGMNKYDIVRAVDRFIEHGNVPSPPTHATNTCDPITGSWTERLLTVEGYDKIYKKAGFSLTVYNGFYNQWQGGAKGALLELANTCIKISGKRGNAIAPFITLVGSKARG